MKLDYTLKTSEERMAVVQAITEDPEAKLTPRYLEIMGDYLMDTLPRTKDYLTPNRLITINKHETSFEGLLEKFESGEDGVYHLFADERNTPLTPKLEITEKDIAEVPGLAELRDRITAMEETVKRASGKDKYVLKKHLIEMRKEQYLLKDSHYQPMQITPTAAHANPIDLAEKRWLDENGEPQSDGLINLFNAEHVSHLLTHYADLKIFTRGKYDDDFYYLIETFTELMDRALADFPVYAAITDSKIDGRSNEEIQKMLVAEFDIHYSVEYISQIWRGKIPKIISKQARQDFILWVYQTEPKRKWKTCTCCQQTKPAHTEFFSHNTAAHSGFYSICKACRAKSNKTKEGE